MQDGSLKHTASQERQKAAGHATGIKMAFQIQVNSKPVVKRHLTEYA